MKKSPLLTCSQRPCFLSSLPRFISAWLAQLHLHFFFLLFVSIAVFVSIIAPIAIRLLSCAPLIALLLSSQCRSLISIPLSAEISVLSSDCVCVFFSSCGHPNFHHLFFICSIFFSLSSCSLSHLLSLHLHVSFSCEVVES